MGTTTEKLTYLQGTKDAIKNAIVAKGVEVPEGTTFRGYAEKVGEIQVGGERIKTMITVTLVGDKMIKNFYVYLLDADRNIVTIEGVKNQTVQQEVEVIKGSFAFIEDERMQYTDSDLVVNDDPNDTEGIVFSFNSRNRIVEIKEETLKISLEWAY